MELLASRLKPNGWQGVLHVTKRDWEFVSHYINTSTHDFYSNSRTWKFDQLLLI